MDLSEKFGSLRLEEGALNLRSFHVNQINVEQRARASCIFPLFYVALLGDADLDGPIRVEGVEALDRQIAFFRFWLALHWWFFVLEGKVVLRCFPRLGVFGLGQVDNFGVRVFFWNFNVLGTGRCRDPNVVGVWEAIVALVLIVIIRLANQ